MNYSAYRKPPPPHTPPHTTVMEKQISHNDLEAIDHAISSGWRYLGSESWISKQHANHESNAIQTHPVDLPSSERLALRWPKQKDIDGLQALEEDPTSKKYALGNPSSTDYLDSLILDSYINFRSSKPAILIAEDEYLQPCVKLTIRPLVPPNVWDVGYATLPNKRGKGYGPEALRCLTRWAFSTQSVQRIELGIKPDNIGSIKVARKAGFHLESVRKSRLKNMTGGYSDEWSFVALAKDPERSWKYEN
jgi:RimJ/RimL family protein N-acetyltransferase